MEAIVIGGSAGALQVLLELLSSLPDELSLPIVILLHVPAGPSRLPSVLATACKRVVREVEDKEPLLPSVVYVAPPNYHLLIERTRELSLSVDEPVNFSRPSIDVLFESAADALGPRVIGVLLSGANEDGAQGLERIRRAGGAAIVQEPSSALVSAMPEAGLVATGRAARAVAPGALSDVLSALSRRELS